MRVILAICGLLSAIDVAHGITLSTRKLPGVPITTGMRPLPSDVLSGIPISDRTKLPAALTSGGPAMAPAATANKTSMLLVYNSLMFGNCPFEPVHKREVDSVEDEAAGHMIEKRKKHHEPTWAPVVEPPPKETDPRDGTSDGCPFMCPLHCEVLSQQYYAMTQQKDLPDDLRPNQALALNKLAVRMALHSADDYNQFSSDSWSSLQYAPTDPSSEDTKRHMWRVFQQIKMNVRAHGYSLADFELSPREILDFKGVSMLPAFSYYHTHTFPTATAPQMVATAPVSVTTDSLDGEWHKKRQVGSPLAAHCSVDCNSSGTCKPSCGPPEASISPKLATELMEAYFYGDDDDLEARDLDLHERESKIQKKFIKTLLGMTDEQRYGACQKGTKEMGDCYEHDEAHPEVCIRMPDCSDCSEDGLKNGHCFYPWPPARQRCYVKKAFSKDPKTLHNCVKKHAKEGTRCEMVVNYFPASNPENWGTWCW